MYNVAPYLPQFFASLENQTADIADLEVVFVDDGSADDSAALVETWLTKGVVCGRLIRQDNAGPAEARNRGLSEVTGDWLTFPDPDDLLSPNYIEVVQDFLASPAAHDVALVSANLLMLDDATGEITDTHPLRAKFANGRTVVDLEDEPSFIHLQSASAFYRLGRILAADIRFDPLVRPNFEDAHFTAYYLGTFDRPRVAVLPEMEYRYRRRSDGSSLIQGSWGKPEKYDDLLEHGYLPVLRDLYALKGYVPSWAQLLVVYDLFFFFRHDGRPNSVTASISEQSSRRFYELLPQVLRYVDTSVIESYDLVPVTDEMRQAMIVAGKGERTFPQIAQLDIHDRPRGLVRAWYYYAGPAPREQWQSGRWDITPSFSKTRAVHLLGRDVMYQRIAWLPDNVPLSLLLDGTKPLPLRLGASSGRGTLIASPESIARHVGTSALPPNGAQRATRRMPLFAGGETMGSQVTRLRSRVRPALSRRRKRVTATALTRYSRSSRVRSDYADAWLLMDRDTLAQDNAERLYEYLREQQPQVNAWFVVSRRSPDWDRLQYKGFRLIEYGSRAHTLALLNCKYVVSSQIDQYVVAPLQRSDLRPSYRYAFLQHGVTKDDLSVWINSKPIDLMITATPDEQAAIVDDFTPYRYTDREIVMTGFPRHDRLLRIAERTSPERRRTVLVCPTWRRELLVERSAAGNARELRADFWHSEYARQWSAFLQSEQLHVAVAEHGWKVAFVPHPNMADYLGETSFGAHVAVHHFADVDIQVLLAGAGVLVTDYSSMAFETAYLQRPAVYFQFDRLEFFNGTHAYRRGTWSYEQSGFGPVTETAEDAVREVVAIVSRGGSADVGFAQRMAATFPLRDGQCSRRAYEAIRAIDEPLPRQLAVPSGEQ